MSGQRRLSISSSSSGDSSPRLSAFDSTSALILEPESESNTPFEFSSDGEDDDGDPLFQIRKPSIPPLTPSIVFMYLLAPYLKLGAMFLPNADLPLEHGIPLLLLFAALSAFARQIWYMLARYLRKLDMEDVILDAFARGRDKERRREVLRGTVRAGTGALRILLAAVYLRESVHVLLPLFPEDFFPPARPVIIVVFTFVVLPLSVAQSLASKRVVYATWTSIATYVLWLCVISYAHHRGILEVNSGWLRVGSLWQGITAIAFTFTSSSTLPLYASLKGSTQHITTARTPRSRSFRMLSSLSVVVAILLTLPLIFFSTHPNAPATDESRLRLQHVIASLNAITLLLAIPSILITTPTLPIPERIRRSTSIPLSKSLSFIMVILLSLIPTSVFGVLSDILLVGALSSTYFLPALIHITTHFFKRPLSIVVPPHASSQYSTSGDGSSTPLPSHDELLQRKERALQRRQFRKRIVWDIGVWVLLLPVGGGGFAWTAGRLAGKW